VATDVTSEELEPPWWRMPKRRGAGRQPLSRDDIVDAAVRVLDAEGLDAVTVRRLAEELATGPATLYWHISGKDELFELVYDRVMGEVTIPEPDPSRWQEQFREFARDVYRVLRSHNDVVRVSLGRIPAGPNMLRIIEWSLGLMRGAGIPDRIAGYAGDLFGRYLDASVLEMTMAVTPAGTDTEDEGIDVMSSYYRQLPAEQFPNLIALSGTMFDLDEDTRFELGLDILISGLEATARGAGPVDD
jgi:AcrR family transcriptional regulator